MTKEQLESIRDRMATYSFDTSSYLKLMPIADGKAVPPKDVETKKKKKVPANA